MGGESKSRILDLQSKSKGVWWEKVKILVVFGKKTFLSQGLFLKVDRSKGFQIEIDIFERSSRRLFKIKVTFGKSRSGFTFPTTAAFLI